MAKITPIEVMAEKIAKQALDEYKYKGKTIACPLLGCSRFDGNGNREKVLEIINNTIKDVNLIIYDYEKV
mgnify:CR=1 FL=1